jgi:hypothetical protein
VRPSFGRFDAQDAPSGLNAIRAARSGGVHRPGAPTEPQRLRLVEAAPGQPPRGLRRATSKEDDMQDAYYGGWQDRDRNGRRSAGETRYERDRYEARAFGRGDEDRYGDEHRRTPREETERLIASDKVEGTRVYSRDGLPLGRIENFMVDKRRGRVEYAVLSFGGFLGVGDRYYPLPWDQLTYDERLGGYRVDITQRDLERAPSHRAGATPVYEGAYGRDILSYYGY